MVQLGPLRRNIWKARPFRFVVGLANKGGVISERFAQYKSKSSQNVWLNLSARGSLVTLESVKNGGEFD